MGVGAWPGFEVLDDDRTLGDKLITTQTLRPAQVAEGQGAGTLLRSHRAQPGRARQRAHRPPQEGPQPALRKRRLTAARALPFNPGRDIREPSIRPMSAELAAKNPTIPNRHFASWTNMRHYYRMYRQASDATIPGEPAARDRSTGPAASPATDFVATVDRRTAPTPAGMVRTTTGGYRSSPRLTFIYSLLSRRSSTSTTRSEIRLLSRLQPGLHLLESLQHRNCAFRTTDSGC